MAGFLKTILESSEEDAFDHLAWMKKSCINISEGLSSEDVLPSPNVGLPSALIPRRPPGAAYVTHTGPLVWQLRQQERLGRAGLAPALAPVPALAPPLAPTLPPTLPPTLAPTLAPIPTLAPTLPPTLPPTLAPIPTLAPTLAPPLAAAPAWPSPAPSAGSSGTAVSQEGPTGAPGHRRPSAPPGVCHTVLFARKPPSAAPARSEPACSRHRE